MKTRISIVVMIAMALAITSAKAGDSKGNGKRDAKHSVQGQRARGGDELRSPVLDFKKKEDLVRYTLTNHTEWVFINHKAGRQVWLELSQDSTGGWTNSWPAGLLWPDGNRLEGSTSANRVNLIQILDNGENWLVVAQGLSYCVSNCSYALQFDGIQNYAITAASPDFCPTTGTIEFWTRTTAVKPQSDEFVFVSTSHRGTREGWWFRLLSNNSIAWNGDLASPWNVDLHGSTAVNDGAWHHIAATFAGGSATFWIDGVSEVTSPYTAQAVTNTRPLFIGEWWEGLESWCNGIIDEVRISSVVRYVSSFTPAYSLTSDSSTIACYRFNEGSGSTAHDETGNHDATLNGSPLPTWVDGR